MATRELDITEFPNTAECQLFPLYEQYTQCEANAGCLKAHDLNYIGTICVDGYQMIAKSLVADNTDHPIVGSTKTVPTWKLLSMTDVLLSLGF